ncbi:hypothetical protein V1264_016397 [Littorina saxatilis]|uniref:Transmembrane protein 45B n=2 Tax=Littorina saxatilis TaxID=31220 RepID=A0AAN9BMF1_9CAEN
MGSFIGHAVPGSFFFLFGLWWLIQVMRRHFLCRQTRQRFRSTLLYPVTCCSGPRMREVTVEPFVKMVLSGCGIVVEIIGGTNHVSHRFDSIGNAQHITMYFFFALSGVFDLLAMKGLAPEGTDYMGVAIALLVEGVLFKFHLFGRNELDVLIHTLLLYVIAFSALVVMLEAAYRKTALLPMLRAVMTMIQGTWFWALGIILYNPMPGAQPWDPENHRSLMLAVVSFSWHVAANIAIAIVVGVVVACCHRNKVQYSNLNNLSLKSLASSEESESLTGNGVVVFRDMEEEVEGEGGGKRRKNGGGHVIRDDDNNSDIEFQAPVRK